MEGLHQARGFENDMKEPVQIKNSDMYVHVKYIHHTTSHHIKSHHMASHHIAYVHTSKDLTHF